MDILDAASELEDAHRQIAIRAARTPRNSEIVEKRRRIALAREIAGQHSVSNPDLVDLGVQCENCAEPLTLSAEDIFCNTDCAQDWALRDRSRRIAGA